MKYIHYIAVVGLIVQLHSYGASSSSSSIYSTPVKKKVTATPFDPEATKAMWHELNELPRRQASRYLILLR